MKNKILTGVLAVLALVSTGGWVMTNEVKDDLNTLVQEQKDDINKKSTEIANLEEVIVERDTDLKSNKVVIDEQDSQINKLEKTNAKVEEENRTLKTHKEQLEHKNKKLTTSNESLKSELRTEKAKKKVVSKSSSKPKQKAVAVATKKVEKPKVVTASKKKETPKPEPKANGRTLTVSSTAYIAMCNSGCSGITATGVDVRNSITYNGYRIIAVDPRVIPLHSIVNVSVGGQSFKAIALDTGGAIKGNKIDILVGSTSEALSFGRKQATVTILK